jgi:hypothetical protein
VFVIALVTDVALVALYSNRKLKKESVIDADW